MNFKPLHDRVLVKRVASDEKTAGGIIIPDTAQEKPMEGEVLEVGSGSRNDSSLCIDSAPTDRQDNRECGRTVCGQFIR